MSNIALIGTGYWGKNLARNFSALGALRLICDTDAGILRTFARQYPGVDCTPSFQEVLENPAIDGVAIATPAATHGALVAQALDAGKDVFVEKPVCLSVETGEALVSTARKKQRILMVGHLLWYHPAVLKLKQLIIHGELGRIYYIYSNRLNLGRIRREENILWSFAPHDLSVILGLLEEMPDTVYARGGSYLDHDNTDVTVSHLSFPSGVQANIFVSWLHPFKEQKLVVVGSRRMAVFNDIKDEKKLTLYSHSIDMSQTMPVANKADGEDIAYAWEEPLRSECRQFLSSMRTRERPRTDGEEGLRVLRVLAQCQQALDA